MGWKLLFLFFAVAAAIDDEEIPDSLMPECLERVYDNCPMKAIESDTGLPRNKEEFQEKCKSMNEFLACVTNELDSCKATDVIETPFYDAQKVFNFICDEDSEVFQIVVENLECFADNLDYIHEPCLLSPQETQDLYDLVNLYAVDDEDALQSPGMCVSALTSIGCITSKIGDKCGKRAADALVEIFQKVDKPFMKCGPGVKGNLALVVDILDTEEELAEDLEEMKKKRKK